MFEVRNAEVEDVPEIVALLAAVASEGRWIATEAPVDRERFTRVFTETIDSTDGCLFVAVDDGAIVGNLGVHPEARGVLGLGMSIADGYRGRGIGTALLQAAVVWAREQPRVHKMVLEVWPHNAPALALYRKLGFVEEGRRRRHYRRASGELWDVIAMGLVLDETSPGSSNG